MTVSPRRGPGGMEILGAIRPAVGGRLGLLLQLLVTGQTGLPLA